MKEYIVTTMKTIQMEMRKNKLLNDELKACKCLTEELRTKIREFEEAALRERREKRAELRQAKRRETYAKKTVCKAFGSNDVSEDSPPFKAAAGFMMGCQQKNLILMDNETGEIQTETRCTDRGRKHLLAEMVTHMYDGEIIREIERAVLKRKRFSIV